MDHVRQKVKGAPFHFLAEITFRYGHQNKSDLYGSKYNDYSVWIKLSNCSFRSLEGDFEKNRDFA